MNSGVLSTAVGEALYDDASGLSSSRRWPTPRTVTAAGCSTCTTCYYSLDDSGVAADNATEAYYAVECPDDLDVTSTSQTFDLVDEFKAAAPRLYGSWIGELSICSQWPLRDPSRVTITGTGAGPIVVIGTTGDPATPLAGTTSDGERAGGRPTDRRDRRAAHRVRGQRLRRPGRRRATSSIPPTPHPTSWPAPVTRRRADAALRRVPGSFPPMRRRLVAALAVVVVVAGACGDDGSAHGPRSELDPLRHRNDGHGRNRGCGRHTPGGGDFTPEIRWGKAKNGVQLGTIEVPIDYDDAVARDVHVAPRPPSGDGPGRADRHAAGQPRRAGRPGPGVGRRGAGQLRFRTSSIASTSSASIPAAPVAATPAIDCFSDYDHFYDSTDITPDDSAERQQVVDLAEELADDCATENAEILQHVGTNDTARDLDSIRRALGEDTISYIGFSYGSMLGAVWATMFPTTVRAAVLDGAPDPTAQGRRAGDRADQGVRAGARELLRRLREGRRSARSTTTATRRPRSTR